jgi:hypothetical protein
MNLKDGRHGCGPIGKTTAYRLVESLQRKNFSAEKESAFVIADVYSFASQ